MARAGPILIDQVRDLPKKENYTTVSVQRGYVERTFNGAGRTSPKPRAAKSARP
jgi:hypothetical protein